MLGVLTDAVPSQAASSSAGPVPLRVGARPAIPRGSTELGRLAPQTALRAVLTLRLRNRAKLTALLSGLSDRSSPYFRHYLTPRQFAAQFGATPAQIAAVDAALRAQGLSPGQAARDGLSIPVRASASALEHAFSVTLATYKLPGGRIAYANTAAPRIPAAAAPYVQGVLGLDNVNRAHSLAARPTAPLVLHQAVGSGPSVQPAASGPSACADARSAATSFGSFTAGALANYYHMSPMYSLGDLGQGARVAIAELEPNDPADIAAYKTCYGLSTTVNYIQVDGGAGTGSGSGEAALDIEDVAGLAPDATIDVYQAPNGGETNVFDMYSAMVNTPADKVISTSWGLCELDSNVSFLQSEQNLFEQAASQGQTVFAAAGDSGSTDCFGDNTSNAGSLAVDDPASQPDVVGVGGTSIGSGGQSVWNSNGAGGGGISAVWCMPSYQYQTAIPGLINSDSQTNSSCSGVNAGSNIRQVPDVSADADPNTGYTIFYNGGWTAIGGTSAAAPLWAAAAALTDASPFCKDYGSGTPGMFPPALYAFVGALQSYVYGSPNELLSDVTSGNNDYTFSGYTGGLYPATTGYDMATGLGTPLLGGLTAAGKASNFFPGLTAVMCAGFATKLLTTSITGISPSQGPTAGKNTVTITGTGFLPIPGADLMRFGSTVVTPSCTSTTKCTVKAPKMKAGSVAVQINVEEFAVSPVTAKTHYRFVAPPSVSSLSPASGPRRGGNRVTIRGHNFIGVTAVHFGSKRATIVRRVSSTEIIVKVPAGSGTVAVTVTAVGGKSVVVRASHYRYRA